MRRLLFLAAFGATLQAQTPDGREIMRRTAESIDRAQTARTAWVYEHNTFVRLKRANGKLAREEARVYTVVPTEKGAERKLVSVDGKILDGAKEVHYDREAYRTKDADIDGAITDNISREVMWRRDSMGLTPYLDPLRTKHLDLYAYKLEGEEDYKGYQVFRVSYRAIQKDDPWEGEALIDRNEYQPVLVTTAWKGKVPKAVGIMFGISIKDIGAKITYQRFDKDVWFPVQCGGEMKFRVLFLYARTLAFSATNKDFRKADVQSSIEFGGEADQ